MKESPERKMSSFEDLLHALPQAKQNPVSLLDALPDPSVATTTVDYESKPSLLESNQVSMSAAEQFAVLMHSKQRKEDGEPVVKQSRKRKSEPILPKRKREKRTRGKQIKSRSRGNQRSKGL
jgi:hypothetical protein